MKRSTAWRWAKKHAALVSVVGALFGAVAGDALSQAQPTPKKTPASATSGAKTTTKTPAKTTKDKATKDKKATGKKGKEPAALTPPPVSSSSEVWTASTGSVATYTPPPPRKPPPPPPTPTPEQLKGLEQLKTEVADYEKEAKEYRDVITGIVRQQFEDKRRRTLAALDNSITVEKQALTEARSQAIGRLEEFVARYSGTNANPESTPDAMFRLAALYEERARADEPDDLAPGLKSAVALYKRVIHEYPQYAELAGIFYYLGHALNDSNRIDEAQQVWRSLVCHNHFPYPAPLDPKDPDKDTIVRMPQDHEEDFWRGWENAHPTPIGQSGATAAGGKKKAAARPSRPGKAKAAAQVASSEETTYTSPYPDDCAPVPQKTEEGAEPRYVAEVWWQIGNWHFDQLDPHGGPYNFNRSATAYLHSMKYKKPPIFGVSMYKLAWTYFKQQRYQAAIDEFVDLLKYTDEQEKLTGDAGTDFRSEAYTYIAGSLTYVDFSGPSENEPFITRSDVLDTESNPMAAEQKMHVAIDRVQEQRIVPQDKKWSVDIYRGLAREFREVNQWHNAIEIDELILKKWPMHRDAPLVQDEIVSIYDELTKLSRDGTVEHDQNGAHALEARTKLAQYVGNMPWVDANRDDPEAIQTAEKLVKGGLRRAAADHTNLARAAVQKAQASTDAVEQRHLLERAIGEYRLADIGWTGYLKQDENAPDAYESRFWIADARHGAIVVAVTLDQTPTQAEVGAARQSAIDVRDSNEDDKFLQPAAFYVVDITEQELQSQYRLFGRSNGGQGIEERKEARFGKAPDGTTKVIVDPIPVPVQQAMGARDEYVARVPASADTTHNSPIYQFNVADFYFVYGHFAEAKSRYEPIWKENCGKSEFGYQAWEKLITIAARSLDVEESRRLADAEEQHSCAVSAEQQTAAKNITGPVRIGGAYIDAGRLFKEAQEMKDGPERAKKWRAAAAAYNVALTQPGGAARDEAPEAAMNGAFAYKQVGEYDKAIGMYQLFIDNYGDEKTLKKLEDDASPKYPERVGYLKQAYDTLSRSYVLFFNYRAAAETYDKISTINRFEEKARRDAARNAMVLYSNLGDRDKMGTAHDRLVKLGASAEDKAEADFIVAQSEMKTWDSHGSDEGANRDARVRGSNAMVRYYDEHRNQSAAAKYAVEAAYNVALMRRASGQKAANEFWKNTISAFEKYRAVAPSKDGQNEAIGSRYAGMAAEADYSLVDERVKTGFDYETGHHRYAGTSVEVIKKYQSEVNDAKKYQAELQHIIDAYASPEWAVAAISRQGSLYDSLRTGLYNVRAPQLKLADAKTEAILKRFEQSDNPDDQDKADQIRQKITEAWRSARERELNGADEVMVHFYGTSLALSKRYNARNAAVNRANQRLAFFTDILGEEKMKQFTKGIQGLDYREKLFLQTRPGLVATPAPQPMPNPRPEAL